MATKTVEIDARVNTLRLERVLLLLAGLFLDIGVACSNTADRLRVDGEDIPEIRVGGTE